MAKITIYSDLNDGTEFTVSLAGSTIALAVAGNLSNDGVLGQALFSASESLWKSGATHNRYRFPLGQAVGELASCLELWGGWANLDATTLTLIRDSGLRYRSGYGAAATVTDEWCCLVQSGTFGLAGTQPYTLLDTDTVPVNLTFTGVFNEIVKIYDSGGDDDRASLKVYAREEGYTYGYYDLTVSQELSTILPVSYLVPMSTVTDTHWSTTDAAIGTDAPYTSMTCYTTITGTGFAAWINSNSYAANAVVSSVGRWYITPAGGTSSGTGVADDVGVTDWTAYSGERDVDGTYYAYNRIIDGNSGTKEQIWEYHQFQLRQSSDIDLSASTQRGDTSAALLSWDGDTLITDTGVFVDNVQSAEESEYRFTDIGGTQRLIVFIPTFTINSVDSSGSSTNFETGTRIQVYDSTNTTELYDNTPGAVSTLGTAHTAGGTVSIRYRVRCVNGTTNASKTIEGTSSISTANVNVNIVQEDNTIYTDNLVDGSAVTGISINANKIDIDISDANDTASWQEVYAWYQDYLNTSAGISDSDNLITANTQVNYSVDSTLQVKNTKTGSPLVITGADVFTTGGAQYDWVDLTGEAIFVLPDTVVNFNSSSGALSAAQETQLANASSTSTAINVKLGTPAGADVSTDVAAIKTDTDSIITSVAALNDFNPATDAVANVTLCATVTTNTDMRGTDSANTTAPDNSGITQIQTDIAALADFDPATDVVEGVVTWKESMRLVVAEAAGSIVDDDAGNAIIKSLDGLQDRITATYAGSSRIITAKDLT